ncbi:MAG: 6,7-dimethyl-8-ribityllumazine synthase [Sphingomonadaceae bacterium]|uniref:6,7-dimethyl-8-ribityllumazine synthase n=1 Tax=Thermaurantiacus sp. TaxID=2820283 RepID=UPI00298F1FF7|nr:6,7-dimethyl-8-ribityllumazine synthase [Thermaurantiacus sp.]MCS6986900.1 6,7-dimethyl-8-ribityllumazine synthase [Sphingomonadaceae bacterium]MDW8415500.1 6,7-dimethyl-8-ribityllumazine synthase [Thermaurantiacus sp.]
MARVGVVVAGFYRHIRDAQVAAAIRRLEEAGHAFEVEDVPGALEVPPAIALLDRTGRFEAFVALGCVIRGETFHFEVVAGESARGLMALALDGVAIGNGILTVDHEAQALARIGKAAEAVDAALALMALKARLSL